MANFKVKFVTDGDSNLINTTAASTLDTQKKISMFLSKKLISSL